jgi:hypothetical protein
MVIRLLGRRSSEGIAGRAKRRLSSGGSVRVTWQANVRASWGAMWALADSEGGLAKLSELLRLCTVIKTREAVWDLMYWMQVSV